MLNTLKELCLLNGVSGDEDEDLGGRCQEAMGLGQEDICLFDALFVSHALAQQAAEEEAL